jgi:glyoxylase-like metal-dependent hydrolase (beta-lactamase superfamily II)
MEVVPGVHRVETHFGARLLSLFLVRGSRRTLLVDSGTDRTVADYVLPYMKDAGIPARIDFLVNTHCDLDHAGGNRTVRETFPDAIHLCHRLDRAQIEDHSLLFESRFQEFAAYAMGEPAGARKQFLQLGRTEPIDVSLAGGERIELGSGLAAEVINTAGHSDGHIAIWIAESGVAIVGDALFGDGVVDAHGSPAAPPLYRVVDDYVETIRTLQALQPEVLLGAHYPAMRGGEAEAFLQSSLEFVERLDDALAALMATTPSALGLASVVASLAPRLGPWPDPDAKALKFPILGHLERMEREGYALRSLQGGVPAWRGV